MTSKNTLLNKIQKRFCVGSLNANRAKIEQWYNSPLGKEILAAEKAIVTQELTNLFGYHLMQISTAPQANLAEESRVNHVFSVQPSVKGDTTDTDDETPRAVHIDDTGLFDTSLTAGGVNGDSDEDNHQSNRENAHGALKSTIGADLDSLPLADESVDVCILHHVLEFSHNPHQVLKEAARVTIARGHIVIVAFNPFSLMGAIKPFKQLFSRNSIWSRHSLMVHRLRDWLEFLDFSCSQTQYAIHNLPVNNQRYLNMSRYLGGFINTKKQPLGASYCLVARKDKACITPLKPDWAAQRFVGGIRKPMMASRTGKDASILPFRRNVAKGVNKSI